MRRAELERLRAEEAVALLRDRRGAVAALDGPVHRDEIELEAGQEEIDNVHGCDRSNSCVGYLVKR